MSDGAHLGVSADRALKTILGGEPSPEEKECMTDEQFRTWIETAPDIPTLSEGDNAYSEYARSGAKHILAYLRSHPEHRTLPLDNEYDWEGWRKKDRPPDEPPRIITEGLWDKVAVGHPAVFDGFSGFMAGWAYNAARKCLDMLPAANPALLTIEVRSEA